MKIDNSFLASAIVSVITLGLLSFKSEAPDEQPIEEYGMIRVYEGFKEEIVFSSNGEKQGFQVDKKHMELEAETTRVITEFLNNGWRIISTDFMPASNSGDGAVKNIKYYHLVRNKPQQH